MPGALTKLGRTKIDGDLVLSMQAPTEAILVSGLDATQGNQIEVTITAARLVGAPLNLVTGQELTFTFIEGGAGAFAITWNAIYKGLTWTNVGNAAGTRSTVSFWYDGTNLNQKGAQTPWV